MVTLLVVQLAAGLLMTTDDPVQILPPKNFFFTGTRRSPTKSVSVVFREKYGEEMNDRSKAALPSLKYNNCPGTKNTHTNEEPKLRLQHKINRGYYALVTTFDGESS